MFLSFLIFTLLKAHSSLMGNEQIILNESQYTLSSAITVPTSPEVPTEWKIHVIGHSENGYDPTPTIRLETKSNLDVMVFRIDMENQKPRKLGIISIVHKDSKLNNDETSLFKKAINKISWTTSLQIEHSECIPPTELIPKQYVTGYWETIEREKCDVEKILRYFYKKNIIPYPVFKKVPILSSICLYDTREIKNLRAQNVILEEKTKILEHSLSESEGRVSQLEEDLKILKKYVQGELATKKQKLS